MFETRQFLKLIAILLSSLMMAACAEGVMLAPTPSPAGASSPTPALTPIPNPTATPTLANRFGAIASVTLFPEPTLTVSPTPTNTPAPASTATPDVTAIVAASVQATLVAQPTPTPTLTPIPTPTPTQTPAAAPTAIPSPTPTPPATEAPPASEPRPALTSRIEDSELYFGVYSRGIDTWLEVYSKVATTYLDLHSLKRLDDAVWRNQTAIASREMIKAISAFPQLTPPTIYQDFILALRGVLADVNLAANHTEEAIKLWEQGQTAASLESLSLADSDIEAAEAQVAGLDAARIELQARLKERD